MVKEIVEGINLRIKTLYPAQSQCHSLHYMQCVKQTGDFGDGRRPAAVDAGKKDIGP
jgi:PTN/MK heparin-binding protein family, N-terminal domain